MAQALVGGAGQVETKPRRASTIRGGSRWLKLGGRLRHRSGPRQAQQHVLRGLVVPHEVEPHALL